MKDAVHLLSQWFETNGLNPADFRLRLEARSIAAQRDLLKAFREDVEPLMAPPVAAHRKGTIDGIEVSVEGPLHGF